MFVSSAAVSSRWNLADQRLVVAAVVVGLSTVLSCSKNWVSTIGISTTFCSTFLGDVVCGGLACRSHVTWRRKVILVASNDLQSLYVANNVCSAVEYFRKLGGNVGVAGLVINKDDGSGEARAFAEAVDIPVLAAIPQDDDLRKKSANYQIVGTTESQWGGLFAELGEAVGMRHLCVRRHLIKTVFWVCSTPKIRVVITSWCLPRTEDMRGKFSKPKVSLEVVYDDA